MIQPRKKLIEVALPLEAINKESAREKSIRHGHPSTLHLWWSRKPLATCRAVLFAQLVDDPSSCPEEFPAEAAQEAERQRLFRIIEELVKWENSNNEAVLHAARTEIARSAARSQSVSLPHHMTPDEVVEALRQYAPPIYDPFCGGGSIPLEAQRLGLEAHASDLNPVAVLINKALIEIPPKFANRPPIHPEENKALLQREWRGAQGLAEDVRFYGKWMRDEAWKRIGHLYPKVTLPKEQGGGEATVIAWIWVRTVTCPNPACGISMPLASKWTLSTKKDKEAYVAAVIDQIAKSVNFEVRLGSGAPVGTVNRLGAKCICCGSPVPFEFIRSEGQSGRMGVQMIAIAAEGKGGRIYLNPREVHVETAKRAEINWKPDTNLPHNPRDFKTSNYGMRTFADLFTPRQLMALTTLSDLVNEVRGQIKTDVSKERDENSHLEVDSYAEAVATYLALGIDKVVESSSSICVWSSSPKNELVISTFRRQAIQMTWDFAEANIFGPSSGSVNGIFEQIAKAILGTPASGYAQVLQQDAASFQGETPLCISTDPPYYDNIGYADLADFFYIWLRRSLAPIYTHLFSTLLTPKALELVASPYRFSDNKEKAKIFFEEGLGSTFERLRAIAHPDYPLSVYYAFKQAETEDDSDEQGNGDMLSASTGWETMLEGLLRSGFAITGTWPMRTERGGRTNSIEANSLASSIVLVCRPRAVDAPLNSRGGFLRELKQKLPEALKKLQRGNIAPVDLAQAAIGPGMAVFSRYSKVLEADGSPMRVRTALQVINQALDEVLAEQEGEYDPDTRWAVAWFEQYGIEDGPYGVAETLSKAKNIDVGRLVEAGILSARGGKVRLLRREELSENWTPAHQARLTVWEVTQRLIHALDKAGEQGAAAVLDRVGTQGEIARDLAYRLYTTCERKGWAQEALAYNSLVVEWRDIAGQAERRMGMAQPELFN